MDHDETPMSRPISPKSESMPTPSEGDLSRIAREAVRQPPDPRLDKQLARMGLTDPSEPAEPRPGRPADPSVVSGSELERLQKELRRIAVILGVLVAAIGILALIEVILLLR